MKKDLSVLMLLVRNSFWRVIGVILVMLAFDGLFFFMDVDLIKDWSLSLEELLDKKMLILGLPLAVIRMTNVTTSFGSGRANKEFYTLKRLQVSERRIWFWQAVHNTGCFFLMLSAEILLFVFLIRYYLANSTYQPVSEQTLFLAFYRNRYLHSLLPMQNLWRWGRNLILIISFGITSAAEPVANRRGVSAFVVYPLMLLAILTFATDMGAWGIDLMVILVASLLAAYAVYYVWKGEEKHDA